MTASSKTFSALRKSVFIMISSFLVFFLSATNSIAQTTLTAGDLAIIGFNTDKSPDDMVILVLKDLSAGTVFYVNDNEVLTAGGTSFADLNEAEASFTVKTGQSIPKGTVLVLPWGGGLTSTTTYDWSVTAGAGLGNGEEIYIYNATSITSTTPTSFIFGATQGANTGLIPNGLTAGITWIDHGSSRAYRYNITGAVYTGTQTELLTAIGNTANYTGAGTYVFTPGDWMFSIVLGNPTVNLSVSANAGTEAGTTVITVTATASSAVNGTQTVALSVSGTGITTSDYTVSNAIITIPDGLATGHVTFTVVDDAEVEAEETATLTISSPTAGIDLGTVTIQNITITDNDSVIPYTLAFNRVDTTVVEGVGTARVWLKVTAVGNTAGTVDLAVSNYSTATGGGTDYTVPVTLNVPANLVLNQLISFDFTINDDGTAEADEYIICKLINASNVTVSSTAQSTLYIKDNDTQSPVATNQLGLNFLTSFSNGASGTNSAEISAYDFASKRLFIANSIANRLDIVNLSNPSAPVLISSVNLGATFNGAINSVAVYNGIVALALEGLTDKQANGKVVFTDTNGVFISEVAVGAMPDMITFNHAGTKVYTANEGEPNAAYTNDPEGSITVIDISSGPASSSAVTIGFTAYNGQESTLRSQGIRIFGLNASAAQDFEPEYITISDDDTKAWVTLQENNALVELNLTNNTIVKLIPLGYKDHSLPINSLDASDQTFGINLSTFPFKGMYLPDAIASYTSGGNIYLITANEGDARAYAGFNEESRVSGLNLDSTRFPNQAELKNNAVLGRLNATNKTGDIDGDGDIDEIYVYGSRSFSIWNPAATAPLVYDSKNELERITASSPFFNMSNGVGAGTLKNRSDDKGPEPEGVVTAKIGGKDYAFVALERIGGVMAYDITNPSAPVFVNYANNRTATGGDRGSEGIIFIPASQSPNGKALVLLSNEVSSTVSIFEIANQKPVVTITSPVNNTIVAAGSGVVNLAATATDADGTITKVEFYYNGIKLLTDSVAPYGLDSITNIEAGVYNVTARAFDNNGDSTVSDTVKVTVTACAPSGSILAEGYLNIPGSAIFNLTGNPKYPNSPDVSVQIGKLEYGPNYSDNYGGRLRGYICAPQTGLYTFYIASDEQSELWLSTNESPANKRRIAYLNSSVPFRAWFTFFTQKSQPIYLVKGAKYYIETLHKEGTGTDHLSVRWVLPDGSAEAPIPANRLSPWQSAQGGQTITVNFGEAIRDAEERMGLRKGLIVKATPNPSTSYFVLTINSTIKENVTITLMDALGRIVERRENIAPNQTVQIGNQLMAAGIYFAEIQQGSRKERVKLIRN